MNPYEALANGIIEQAAKDHRSAAKFLRRNPRNEILEKIVARQIAERNALRAERKALGLKPEKGKTSREERKLNKIISCESMIVETERFFLSDWFTDLTEVDGAWLLENIKKKEA